MTENKALRHYVVAITGASGIIYAQRLLQVLRRLPNVYTHLIISPSAELTLKQECPELTLTELKQLADEVHNYKNIGDKLSSGSVKTAGMIIVPCSIKTMSGIANCYDDNLIVRAADVHLKERRKLIICIRETPLHLGHLRLLTSCAEYGSVIMPLMPAFYHSPQTIDDIVNQNIARVCDQLDLEYPEDIFAPWQGLKGSN